MSYSSSWTVRSKDTPRSSSSWVKPVQANPPSWTSLCVAAQEANPDVIAAIGECNAQTGAGDPYLPFRQVLTVLTGADDPKRTDNRVNATNATRLKEFVRVSGETLLAVGPDLIGIFVPGAALVAKIAITAAKQGKLADKLAERVKAGEGDCHGSIAGPGADLRAIHAGVGRAQPAADARLDPRRLALGGQRLAESAIPPGAPTGGQPCADRRHLSSRRHRIGPSFDDLRTSRAPSVRADPQ